MPQLLNVSIPHPGLNILTDYSSHTHTDYNYTNSPAPAHTDQDLETAPPAGHTFYHSYLSTQSHPNAHAWYNLLQKQTMYGYLFETSH
jgi:hypothetical protein